MERKSEWVREATRLILAFAAGWIIWLFYQHVCEPFLNGLFYPWQFTLPSIFGWGTPHGLGWWVIWVMVRAFSGWAVARLNREKATATVVLFAGSVLLWKGRVLPWTFHLLGGAGDPRYLRDREIIGELLGIVVPFVSILLGGLWRVPSPSGAVRSTPSGPRVSAVS